MKLTAFALLLLVVRGIPDGEAQVVRERATSHRVGARMNWKGAAGAPPPPPASQRKRGRTGLAAGRRSPPAPDIIIIGLDGKNILLGEKRGKVVIVDFWASWCPPCRRMVPIFNSLHEKYSNRGLEVIGISMDEGTTTDLKGLADEFGVRYTAADGDRETEEAFKVEALPTTLLIDRKGRIRARHKGAISRALLEREIKRLLSE
jgi:thiol-disulfide isomerase/thioredoxin